MGNVNVDGIWTPDEGDKLDPDVWSAAMADSISQGLGVRVAKQERFEGAFLNIQDPYTIPNGVPGDGQAPLPFIIGSGSPAFLNGDMTLVGGVLKVVHSGLYTATLMIRANMPTTDPAAYIEATLFKNSSRHGQNVTFKDAGAPAGRALPTLVVSTVMNCVENDTIWASGFQYYGDTTSGAPSLNVDFSLFNTLSVAMTQAL